MSKLEERLSDQIIIVKETNGDYDTVFHGKFELNAEIRVTQDVLISNTIDVEQHVKNDIAHRFAQHILKTLIPELDKDEIYEALTVLYCATGHENVRAVDKAKELLESLLEV